MQAYPMTVGAGKVIHISTIKTAKGVSPQAICGKKPNRTGNYVRMNIEQNPGTPVTCPACIKLFEALKAKK